MNKLLWPWLLLALPLVAGAQDETLDFVAPIGSIETIYNPVAPGTPGTLTSYPVGEDLTGVITLSAPLPLNGVTTIAAVENPFGTAPSPTATVALSVLFNAPPISLGMYIYPTTIPGSPEVAGVPVAGYYAFTFTTQAGAVTAYSLGASTAAEGGGPGGTIQSITGTSGGTTVLTSANEDPEAEITGYTVTAGTGSWSIAAATAPEINPAGALGALTLLAGLLAVARGRRRT